MSKIFLFLTLALLSNVRAESDQFSTETLNLRSKFAGASDNISEASLKLGQVWKCSVIKAGRGQNATPLPRDLFQFEKKEGGFSNVIVGSSALIMGEFSNPPMRAFKKLGNSEVLTYEALRITSEGELVGEFGYEDEKVIYSLKEMYETLQGAVSPKKHARVQAYFSCKGEVHEPQQ